MDGELVEEEVEVVEYLKALVLNLCYPLTKSLSQEMVSLLD